jgi:anaerobic magnesium-protoporphyrin IX monomethyl ester cyclase
MRSYLPHNYQPLFINPPSLNTIDETPTFHDEEEKYLEPDDFGHFPPLGLLYVLSNLEKKAPEHNIKLFDCVAEKWNYDKVRSELNNFKPDVVGITSFTISLIDVLKTARLVREIHPNAHICLGGHHPIAFPFEAAQLKEFDSIVVGEGEIVFAELVKALEEKRDFTDILGVYTKESIQKFVGKPVPDKRFLSSVVVPPAYIEEINDLPPPNRNHIKHLSYNSIIGASPRLATIISSRGCPYKCTFCDVPYKRYRNRDVAKLVDEIERFGILARVKKPVILRFNSYQLFK